MLRRALLALTACLFVPLMASAGAGDAADATRLDQLFGALQRAGPEEWQAISDQIRAIWAESGSPSLDLLYQRGEQALSDNDPQAAIEHFTAVIENAPDFAAAWNGRATAYYMAGLFGPALEDIAQVLALEPRHFGALTGLAVMLEEMGRLDLARAAYEQVLALSPGRTDIREALRALELKTGTFDI